MNRRAKIRFGVLLILLGVYLFGCGGGTHVGPPLKPPLNPSAVPILLCEWNTGNFGTAHISRDGSKVAVVHDFKIELYDTHNCQQLWQQPFGQEVTGILDFTASEDLTTVAILYDDAVMVPQRLEIYDTVQRTQIGLREKWDEDAFISRSGNYIILQGADTYRGWLNPIILLNRTGEKLWEGNSCNGYPLDMSMSYDAEYITCDLDIYDRNGNFLWQAAPSDLEYVEGTTATAEISAQISRDGQFVAFTYAEFSPSTYYARYHFQLRTITGQLLWDKNLPIFDMRFADDATRLLGLEIDGLLMFDQAGNQLWHFNPGYEQSVMDGLISLSSNGLIVAAVLYPFRDWQEEDDLVTGMTSTTHTLYVVNGLTGAVLWQNSFGDLGLAGVEISGDGLILAFKGNKMLRTYDLTPIVQPPGTGGRVPPPGGGG